ncbi:MAG TPA: tetratricopeptide repeat protein [Longimicrobiales bacterium]
MGKTSGAFVVLALLLVPMAARAQGKPSGNLWTRSAELYLNQGLSANNPVDKARFYKQALDQAQLATQKDPNNALGWQLAGKIYVAMGDAPRADSALARAESLYAPYVTENAPLREQAWVDAYNAGVTALRANKNEEAIAAFERADRLYQGRANARMMLASIYLNQQNYDKAAEEYKAALAILQGPAAKAIKPEQQKQWRDDTQRTIDHLGQLLMATKKYDDAAALFRQQAAANPTDLTIKTNLARALAMAGKTDQAKAIFAEMVTMPNLTDEQYFDAGVALFRAQDFAGAAAAFRKAVAANPYNHGALYNLSNAVLAQAQPIEEAREKAAPAARKPFAVQLAPLFTELNDVASKFLEMEPANMAMLQIEASTARALADIAATPAEEAAGRAKALKILTRAEALAFEVSDATVTESDEGTKLTGTITNRKLAAGGAATFKVTFLDKSGTALDTQDVSVPAPAKDQTAEFTVSSKAKNVAGWKYELK